MIMLMSGLGLFLHIVSLLPSCVSEFMSEKPQPSVCLGSCTWQVVGAILFEEISGLHPEQRA